MKKNVYLTILMLATVGCMVFGVLGRMTDLFPNNKLVARTEKIAAVETEYNEIPDRIKADMDMGNLIIRKGDSLQVLYEGESRLEPETTLKEGTLTIHQKKDKSLRFGIHKNEKAELTVIIPEEVVLSHVDVDLDLGKIEMEDLRIGQGTIQNDLGDIDIQSCTFDEVDIDIDAGDLDVENCTFQKLSVDQDLGDVDISTPQDLSDATIDMKISLGSLRVNGTKQGNEFTQKGSGDITLHVSNDMGDIDLQYAE